MFSRFNSAMLLRLFSLFVFFLIPSVYLPDLLPQWVLPVLSVLSVLLSRRLEASRLRLIPVLVISLVVCAILFIIMYLITLFSALSSINNLFLHIALAYGIYTATVTISILSTLLWIRFTAWKKIEPLVLAALFALLFWSQGKHNITVFPHPLYLAILTAVFLIIILFRIVTGLRTGSRRLLPVFAFSPLFIAAIVFIISSFNALSVTNNGGLIQPTLFRFDFSPYLSLQNEIKINDKLVLIVRTGEQNALTLLRRIYLSGWDPSKGFFEEKAPGELTQLTNVPGQETKPLHPEYLLRSPAEQEYFIINFDPSSLIAMDYPVRITPYKIWNSTSFNGAYSVTSEITGFIPFELFDCKAPNGTEPKGLSPEALSFYTAIDPKTEILVGNLARTLTANIPGYYDRIQLLNSYLKDGDFRYSLKPGIAPDGNQLRYFLEDTKKGYCTYFAFSLCLMLRSIGIPSRVAAGFFIQPDSGALNYYPIRANMAHAWVEVFFPDYGWIAFDPTSNEIAEGEDLQISSNAGGDEFLQLLTEIIEKRNLLVPENKETLDLNNSSTFFRMFAALISLVRRSYGLLILLILLSVPFLICVRRKLIIKFSTNDRKVILELSANVYHSLRASGNKRARTQSRKNFIKQINDPIVTAVYELEQIARYAPELPSGIRNKALTLEKAVRSKYRRRLINQKIPLLFVFLMASLPSRVHAQEINSSAEAILAQAKTAIETENWESAINLLSGGIHAYPTNPSFHFTLGSLYSDQKLYKSARSELLEALDLGYPEPEIYSEISEVSSFLNLDEEALGYIKTYLEKIPDDMFAWSNYGWLCYKTNKLDEGIAKLHAIIDKYGPDSNLYVGLGNLYTAAFNYPEAKKYYTLAIQTAEASDQTYHASIDYYNRSILEEIFYHFDEAYQDTARSLEATPRSSGYLMQGELELRRHAFKSAFAQYLKAFNLDSTPLASMGLADTLIQAGYPDEAARYMKAIQKQTDMSWISNYGTTTDHFKSDTYKLLRDIDLFRINSKKREVVHSLSTFVFKYTDIIKYSFFHWYHDALYRIMTNKVAKYYETSKNEYKTYTGQGLHVTSFYFLSFNKWHLIAAPFLNKARYIETEHIAAANPSYLYEQAHLSGDSSLMETAIATLDPIWERQYLSKALAETIAASKTLSPAKRQLFIQNLYTIHPASFVINTIKLPVEIRSSPQESAIHKKRISKIAALLLHAGFIADTNSVFSILIDDTESSLILSLQDKNNNRTIYTQVMHKSTDKPQDIYSVVNSFSTGVFKTDLGF